MKQTVPPPEDKNAPLWRIPDLFKDLTGQQFEALSALHQELLQATKTMNLIPSNTVQNADIIHFADCIFAAQAILKVCASDTIYDFGAGNGFPGLVLGILDPSKKIIIVDRDKRKCEFLTHAATKIGLKNVHVECKRIEEIPENSISCAVSRGFASISKSILATRKMFKKDGDYFHLKGDNWGRELAEIPSQLCSYWTPSLFAQYELPIRKQPMAIVLTKKT